MRVWTSAELEQLAKVVADSIAEGAEVQQDIEEVTGSALHPETALRQIAWHVTIQITQEEWL